MTLFSVLFVAIFLSACAGALEAGPQVPAVSTGRMLVTTDWLERNLHSAELVVVHVAEERDGYEQAHIPGARFVRWDDIAVTRDGVPNQLPSVASLTVLTRRLGIDENSWVVAYDEGAGLRAARFYVAMDYLGLGDRTALLDGQLAVWRAENRDISTEAVLAVSSRYVPTINPSVLITLRPTSDVSWLAENLPDSPVSLVDARPQEEYTGAEPGTDIERAGHVPGAAGIFWERHLVSPERPLMRPRAELQAIYHEHGIEPGDLVIAYCRTGGQASHAYFTAKYLGYETRIYDGSYIEWQAAEYTSVNRGESP
jgi:thiosulfate/3-mercaptopyruvate sulfurtransferase